MLECASFEYLRSLCAHVHYSRVLIVVHVVAMSFPLRAICYVTLHSVWLEVHMP